MGTGRELFVRFQANGNGVGGSGFLFEMVGVPAPGAGKISHIFLS